MDTNILLIVAIVIGFLSLALIALVLQKIAAVNSKITLQSNVISKMQSAMRARNATNAVAQNAEIIYQNLLQNLVPIAAAAEASPRDTDEHILWRTAGGLLDEYAKNPFVLEQVRRAIKLDANVASAAENYIAHASKLLELLAAADTDGLLAASFSDGLLGQTMTFLAQAKQLANN